MADPDPLAARMDRLEARMDRLDSRQDEQAGSLAECRRDQAVLRESLRIFEDLMGQYSETLRQVAADVVRMRDALMEHIAREGKDRLQMLVGIITAALSGVGTLGILAWGVYHLVERGAP